MDRLLMWLIDFLRDIQVRRGKSEKDIQYLCSHLVVSLERYIDGCSAVAGDDGESDEDGYSVAQMERPVLGVDPNNPELKLLPTPVMHALVQFPRDIEIANAIISGASEHASPPDYEEAFEERQYQYAKLGLKAHAIASELRRLSSMPPQEQGEWNVVEYLNQQLSRIEEYRSKRAKENARFWESIQSTSSGGA